MKDWNVPDMKCTKLMVAMCPGGKLALGVLPLFLITAAAAAVVVGLALLVKRSGGGGRGRHHRPSDD